MASFLDYVKSQIKRTGLGKLADKAKDTYEPMLGLDPSKRGSWGVSTNTWSPVAGAHENFPSNPLDSTNNDQNNQYPTDTTSLATYQNGIRDKIGAIMSAYDALGGAYDRNINDKIAEYNKQYDQQAQDLNKQYQNSTSQTVGMFGARGLGDSSFLANEQQNQGDVYNQNVNQINQSRANTMGSLGQQLASYKANIANSRNGYADILNNLGKYDQTALQNLDTQLSPVAGGVSAQAAGLGSNQQFVDQLNQFAPQANTGGTQLAQRLQALVTSGAPSFAKKQIAQGLIKQAQLTDPQAQSYWNNEFERLLNGA